MEKLMSNDAVPDLLNCIMITLIPTEYTLNLHCDFYFRARLGVPVHILYVIKRAYAEVHFRTGSKNVVDL